MPKVCSNRTCTRLTEGKFKVCQGCRDKMNKRIRKLKEIVAKATARDGYKYCRKCFRDFPLTHFKPSHSRRKTLTAHCATCRASATKTNINKTSKTGKCRQVWLEWKKEKCELCGYQGDNIEADHRADRGPKIHICSEYIWWARHGGVPALEAELKKTRPLCTFCHRLVTQQERGVQKSKSVLKRKAYVNQIKLKIGECQICKRKLEKEQECCAFDFDHIDTKLKQDGISKMVLRYTLKRFFQCIDLELAKCRLICCMCHMDHSRQQKREKTLAVQQLALSIKKY